MDPEANLKEQRAIARRILDGEQEPNPEDGYRLAELVDALDQWLKKGGFLPKDWRRPVRLD